MGHISKNNEVVLVLMRRDDMSEGEAIDLVEEVIEAIENVGYEPAESEEILMDMLGLEPDYLEYLF